MLLLYLFLAGALAWAAPAKRSRCSKVLGAAATPFLQAELVADSHEIERLFLETELHPRLAFDFSPLAKTIRREVQGLESGMAFSLLRHLHEGKGFAQQENSLIDLWVRRDVLYFSPGHGSPGAQISVQGSSMKIKNEEVAFIRVRIDIDALIDLIVGSKAVERATTIYYASCNAGLPSVVDGVFHASAAERLARQLNRSVIAPNGAIIQIVTSKEPLLVYVSVSQTNADGNKFVLHENEAFSLFHPDGTSEPIPFKEAMELVSRPEAKNQYINSWNPVSESRR